MMFLFLFVFFSIRVNHFSLPHPLSQQYWGDGEREVNDSS